MNVILWSGGWDSTALVLRAIEAGKPFKTVAGALVQNSWQHKAEKRARAAIIAYFAERNVSWWHDDFDILPVNRPCGLQIIQPLIWLTRSIFFVGLGDTLEIGWIRGDDVWHYRDTIHSTWLGMTGFYHVEPGDAPRPALSLPLEWESKDADWIVRLYAKHSEVVPLLSVCEEGSHWMFSQCAKGVEMRRLATLVSARIVADGQALFAAKPSLESLEVEAVAKAADDKIKATKVP